MMQQVEQIRAVTKQYTMFLYTIALALLGFTMVLGGVIDTLWVRWFYWSLFPTQADQNSMLANITVLATLFFPTAIYFCGFSLAMWFFVRRYGQVKNNKKELYQPVIEGVIAYIIYLITEDNRLHLPVCLSLITLAVILIVHWQLFARKQTYYPVLAVIAILVSIVPLFDATVYQWLYFYAAPDWYQHIVDIPTGIILCIAGLLDFQYIRRMLRRVRQNIATSIHTAATS